MGYHWLHSQLDSMLSPQRGFLIIWWRTAPSASTLPLPLLHFSSQHLFLWDITIWTYLLLFLAPHPALEWKLHERKDFGSFTVGSQYLEQYMAHSNGSINTCESISKWIDLGNRTLSTPRLSQGKEVILVTKGHLLQSCVWWKESKFKLRTYLQTALFVT